MQLESITNLLNHINILRLSNGTDDFFVILADLTTYICSVVRVQTPDRTGFLSFIAFYLVIRISNTVVLLRVPSWNDITVAWYSNITSINFSWTLPERNYITEHLLSVRALSTSLGFEFTKKSKVEYFLTILNFQ